MKHKKQRPRSGAATKRTKAEWAELMAEWGASEQSAEEFCSARGIRPSTFGWWRWRLGASQPATAGSRQRRPRTRTKHLVKVEVVPEPTAEHADARWVLRTSSGDTVEVHGELQRDLLALILETRW